MSVNKLAAAAAITGVLWGFNAAAQPVQPLPSAPEAEFGPFVSCTDHKGRAAIYMTDAQYEQNTDDYHWAIYAGARYLQSGPPDVPAIVLDEDFIRGLQPLARAFTYAHECYHLHSGDAERVYLSITAQAHDRDVRKMEDDADCAAAKRLRDELGATEDDILGLRPVINATTSGQKNEERRMNNILACYAAP